MRRRSRSSAIKEMCIRTAIRHQGPPRRLAKLKHARSAGGRGGAADAAGQTRDPAAPGARGGPPGLRSDARAAPGSGAGERSRQARAHASWHLRDVLDSAAQRTARGPERRSPIAWREKEGRQEARMRGSRGDAGASAVHARVPRPVGAFPTAALPCLSASARRSRSARCLRAAAPPPAPPPAPAGPLQTCGASAGPLPKSGLLGFGVTGAV